MHLNIVLRNESGFSPEELQHLIAFFRENFNGFVLPEKQSILIRAYSRFFLNQYKKMILYFSYGNGDISCGPEMTGASLKLDISDFEKMATEIFSEDSIDFKLHCKGPAGLEARLSFEKCGVKNKVRFVFIESDNPTVALDFSKTFAGYAFDRKFLTITTDRGSFLNASRMVHEESEAQFKSE